MWPISCPITRTVSSPLIHDSQPGMKASPAQPQLDCLGNTYITWSYRDSSKPSAAAACLALVLQVPHGQPAVCTSGPSVYQPYTLPLKPMSP